MPPAESNWMNREKAALDKLLNVLVYEVRRVKDVQQLRLHPRQIRDDLVTFSRDLHRRWMRLSRRTRWNIVDTVITFFFFTPLVILYWQQTYALLHQLLRPVRYTLPGAIIVCIIGLGLEIGLIRWKTKLKTWFDKRDGFSRFYRPLHVYVLSVSYIAVHKGIQDIYRGCFDCDVSIAITVSITSTIVLIYFTQINRCLTVPYLLKTDADECSEISGQLGLEPDWLTKWQPSTKLYLRKDVAASVFIRKLVPAINWISLTCLVERILAPAAGFRLTLTCGCVGGYALTCCCVHLREHLEQLQWKLSLKYGQPAIVLLENAFLIAANMASIMVWATVGQMTDIITNSFPITYGQLDITPLYVNIVVFVLLYNSFVSETLLGQGQCLANDKDNRQHPLISVSFFSRFMENSEMGTAIEFDCHASK